jgi:hypothetical protein
MNTFAQYLLDFLKLTPRYFITLGGAAAFLLFTPERFTKDIGVYEFTKNNRPIVGIIFILSSALLVVTIAIEITKWIKEWWIKRNFYRQMSKRLDNLTEDEKQILRFYIIKQTKSNFLRIDDGIVQGLISIGIIYRAAPVGYMINGFAHNISDFAWDYLNKYQHLLEGSSNIYRTDKEDKW